MKRVIRNNVFETNSSSSHSLVICKPTPAKKWLTEKECRWSLGYHYNERTGIYSPDYDDLEYNFNRAPFKVVREFKEKLMFLYANSPIRERGKDKEGYTIWEHEYYKISRVVKTIIPGYKKFKWNLWRPSCEAYGVLETIKEHMTLKEFLINPNVIVICDGDEYQVWNDMKKLDMIATHRFTEIRFAGG